MKTYGNAQNTIAAGVTLTLVVIIIIACTPPGSSSHASVAETKVVALPTLSAPTTTALDTKVETISLTTEPDAASPSATPATIAVVTPTDLPLTAPSTAAPSPSAGVEVYETTVTLPTYPFRDFLVENIDPIYNIAVYYFNRADYDAVPHEPTPVDYTGIVLENPYLRLTFLPELGGRLYSAVVKSTGQEIFYHNPVVKPSRYGVLQPYEANWWLATGGMDWAYPTQEHGYRFGIPWNYEVAQSETEATITLSDTDSDRVGLTVQVTLPADKATFNVAPTLINNTTETVPVQVWINAALTLGASTMSTSTQFIVPTTTITVHSRGEAGWKIPGEHETAPWPQVGETDLRDYNQWANYLGFFVPNQAAPFFGAYNPDTDLGVVRLSSGVPGSNKLFAFGQDFPDRSYTDDNSQYFEIWGGANAGFWAKDDIPIPAGETLGWQDTWWPLAQSGGLTWATDTVAIHVVPEGEESTLTALVAQPIQGRLEVSTGETVLLQEPFLANPNAPVRWSIPATDTPLTIQFFDAEDTPLLRYPG